MASGRALRLVPPAAVAGAIAVGVVVLALNGARQGESTPTPTLGSAIEARAVLTPRDVLFGDTMCHVS